MLIKLIIRCERAFVNLTFDALLERWLRYKVCFDRVILILIILLVIIFRNKINFIKVFRRRILIKGVLIMLIVLLVIQRRIFLTFDMIGFSNNKGLSERIFIEISGASLIVSLIWVRICPLTRRLICVSVYDL